MDTCSIGQSIKSPERPCVSPCVRPTFEAPYLDNGARWAHGRNGPSIGNCLPRVEWSRDRWRQVTARGQGRDSIFFEAAIKLFNFYHWPTQLTHLIYTDFTVSYRDALHKLRVRLNTVNN